MSKNTNQYIRNDLRKKNDINDFFYSLKTLTFNLAW